MSAFLSQSLTSLIVGCWQLDDRSWKSLRESDVAHAIDTYLAWGITCFDTADIYGRSESILGRLLKGRDCTILTKVVFFDQVPTPHQVRGKVETALRNLQRDHLDVLQVYWHDPGLDFASTLEQLQGFVDQGIIHTLGATNFNTEMLERARRYASIRTHQVQYSLIDRRVENGMQTFCVDHDIALLPYGPLAGGFLSHKFRSVTAPPAELDHARSFYYSSMIRAHGGWMSVQAMLETLHQMAQKYGKTIDQVALNWVKQQLGVVAVIAGLTLDRQQIQRNATALGWSLDPADLALLSQKSAALFQQSGDIYSYERQPGT